MAVEARHLNLFPPQILSNREMVMNGVEGGGNAFSAPMGYGLVTPLSGTTTATETMVPLYGSATTGTLPVKTAAMKSESGLTYVPVSRKRSREADNSLLSSIPSVVQNQSVNNHCGTFTFLGEDISFQIQQQQLEIDRFMAQHTEKVRMEIEERRKRYSRRIAAAVEESIMKKLKAKEEEIVKIGKLNWALEERVKSLCVENQIWRDLAQTNEATANALRCNLEQVLARVQDEQQQQRQQRQRAEEADLMDDAHSCCGSNVEEIDRRTLAESASTEARDRDCTNISDGCIAPSNSIRNRMCRSCEKEESCVLLLPCRHLCLCTICGSTLHTCPVCNSTKTASVHVNLSF
ncbi:hypothetical protein Pfo_022998 [Paulownia fortunei]|nr:hypothetical protein Pfo_022998 [Paulownia fortunei]